MPETPRVIKGIQTNPFRYDIQIESVFVDSDQVMVGTDEVQVDTRIQIAGTKEVVYLTIIDDDALTYTFSTYNQPSHVDWPSVNGEGIDANAFLLTGVLSGGDFQRKKQIGYLTMHFNRTETYTGGEVGSLGNQSSCLTQVQWDWSNDPSSNRWTIPMQTYRVRAPYYPKDVNDFTTPGFTVIETRNKIRGNGKVLSILMSSEPEKHLTIYGWSMTIGSNSNV